MKPTKEEVKEYFKDALEIYTPWNKETYETELLDLDSIHEFDNDIWVDFKDDIDCTVLWDSDSKHKGYAKITKRRESDTLTVPKHFVLDAYDAACSDWKEKLRLQFPDLFPTFSVKIGDRFEYNGNEYILARLELNVINLIKLNNGYNWTYALKVQDCNNITQQEFEKLCEGSKFNKIS